MSPIEVRRQCLSSLSATVTLGGTFVLLTVLEQNVETFLHEEIGIENYQSKRERQNIITGSDFEEIPNCFLQDLSAQNASCIPHLCDLIAVFLQTWGGMLNLPGQSFAPCLGGLTALIPLYETLDAGTSLAGRKVTRDPRCPHDGSTGCEHWPQVAEILTYQAWLRLTVIRRMYSTLIRISRT